MQAITVCILGLGKNKTSQGRGTTDALEAIKVLIPLNIL